MVDGTACLVPRASSPSPAQCTAAVQTTINTRYTAVSCYSGVPFVFLEIVNIGTTLPALLKRFFLFFDFAQNRTPGALLIWSVIILT